MAKTSADATKLAGLRIFVTVSTKLVLSPKSIGCSNLSDEQSKCNLVYSPLGPATAAGCRPGRDENVLRVDAADPDECDETDEPGNL